MSDSSHEDRWGCPDWRDRGAYTLTDESESWRWKWEFLRRTPDYRDLWMDVKDTSSKVPAFLTDVSDDTNQHILQLMYGLDWVIDPHLDNRLLICIQKCTTKRPYLHPKLPHV